MGVLTEENENSDPDDAPNAGVKLLKVEAGSPGCGKDGLDPKVEADIDDGDGRALELNKPVVAVWAKEGILEELEEPAREEDIPVCEPKAFSIVEPKVEILELSGEETFSPSDGPDKKDPHWTAELCGKLDVPLPDWVGWAPNDEVELLGCDEVLTPNIPFTGLVKADEVDSNEEPLAVFRSTDDVAEAGEHMLENTNEVAEADPAMFVFEHAFDIAGALELLIVKSDASIDFLSISPVSDLSLDDKTEMGMLIEEPEPNWKDLVETNFGSTGATDGLLELALMLLLLLEVVPAEAENEDDTEVREPLLWFRPVEAPNGNNTELVVVDKPEEVAFPIDLYKLTSFWVLPSLSEQEVSIIPAVEVALQHKQVNF